MDITNKFDVIFNKYQEIQTEHISSISFGQNREKIPIIKGKKLFSLSNCYVGRGRLLLKIGGIFEKREQIIIQNPIIGNSDNDEIIEILYSCIH